MSAENSKPRIVIIGMGDAGLLSAIWLGDDYDITGISTKPLMVSGQELGARLTRLPTWKDNYHMGFDRFKHMRGVTVIQGRAERIEPKSQQVHVTLADSASSTLDYDILVIASGTRNGFWRNDEIQSTEEIEAELGDHAASLVAAKSLTIIGGGPTAVSTASNVRDVYPDKPVSLYFRQDQILTGYPPRTREFVTEKLKQQGVDLYPSHEATVPKARPLPVLKPGTVSFQSSQLKVQADCILWAVGETTPNNSFIPKDMLDSAGFVNVDPYFRVSGQKNIFAIGDIAATDPHRSSARNEGYKKLARNICHTRAGRDDKMKPFKAPKHRWGSVIGQQAEGLRIFTPKGGNIRIRPWAVRVILFPVFVWKAIYRGRV